MWRTLLFVGLCALQSGEYRAFSAASQSNGDRADRALKGDLAMLALRGESMVDTAGDDGTCSPGNDVMLMGGADIG